MLSRIAVPRHLRLSVAASPARLAKPTATVVPRRWHTPAPRASDSTPLMSRRADRELPDVDTIRFSWMRTLPLFLLAMGVSTIAIINYQKVSSSPVASILYALRTSARARELLGDEIYFASQIPWISGEMAQMRGRMDISFRVRGTRATGTVRLNSRRPTDRGMWETLEYSLEVGEEKVDLLEEEGEGFAPLVVALDETDLEVKNRGFRQAYKG